MKNLNFKNAIKRVHELTPQIIDYDKFMHVGSRWIPYVMYFHYKNFRSKTINTDSLGFRYTMHNKKKYGLDNLPQNTTINLFVGGSATLGVGSTSDEKTIASFLSNKTDEIWINFSGRGFNAIQELIMFLINQDKFYNINNVIVMSGMNTLVLEGIPEKFADDDYDKYYYSYEYQHYMNLLNKDMKSKKDSFDINSSSIKTFFKDLKNIFSYENPLDTEINDEKNDLDARVIIAAKRVTDALVTWRLLLNKYENSKLYFVLQPLSDWTEKKLTEEEKSVFHAVENCPNNFYRLFQNILTKDVYKNYFNKIKSNIKGISCLDMNILLKEKISDKDTIFVDRVHFNDKGNEIIANIIYEEIISKQERTQ